MPPRNLSVHDVRELYDRHGAALVACACSLLGDYGLAEDVVQNVFLRALRGDLSPPQSPTAYFYRAVKNAALNARRDRRREEPLGGETDWLVHKSGDREATLALRKALDQLPFEQREIVILHYWSGLTFAEAGEALGIPANTAASRYRYALEKLREIFADAARSEVVFDVPQK